MKSFLIFISLFSLAVAQPENPGPYKAGWTNVTLNRGGRVINAIIYYPSFVEGAGVQIDTVHGPYSIIAFGHGFFMQNSYYTSLFKHLATHGHIIIAPQFPDNSHLQLAYDLIFCVNHIKAQNQNRNSIFYKLVDTLKVGLSGHSMGGGSSLLASTIDTSIVVVAPLAAAETNPSIISSMNKIRAVVYLITAQNDGITPPQTNQIPMYNNANPIKAIPILKGANHTKFMDTRFWDWTDPRGYLTAEEQLRLTRKYLTGIFNLFLKNDTSFFKYAFGNYVQNDTSVIFNYQLKPLYPLPFNLVFPVDTTLSENINFKWRSTFSLNLYDTVKYKLLIATDSVFNNIVFVADQLSDTSFSLSLNSGGNYFWKVIAYTSDSTTTESNISKFSLLLSDMEENSLNLLEFQLYQNYPNPFNSSTKIRFKILKDVLVSIKLFNPLGEEVGTLIEEPKFPGEYEIEVDSISMKLKSGIYIYQMMAGQYSFSRKFLLIK